MIKPVTLALILALPILPLQARTAQIWEDVSGSVNREISVSTDEYLGSLLSRTRGIDRIEIYGFASGLDALRTPAAVIDLSKVPSSPNCTAKGEALIFATVSRRQTAECEAEKERYRQNRERVLASISRQVSDSLQRLEAKPTSRTTCLFQVLERCSMQGPGQVCIVVTDGAQENCPLPPRPSAMGGAQVIVILVPKKGDDEEAVKLLEERSRNIRAFSRITVIPLFRMENDLPGLIGK